MAKRKAHASFKILRRGNPERIMTVTGKTIKDAESAGRSLLRRMGIAPDGSKIGGRRKLRKLVGGKKRRKTNKTARKRKAARKNPQFLVYANVVKKSGRGHKRIYLQKIEAESHKEALRMAQSRWPLLTKHMVKKAR